MYPDGVRSLIAGGRTFELEDPVYAAFPFEGFTLAVAARADTVVLLRLDASKSGPASIQELSARKVPGPLSVRHCGMDGGEERVVISVGTQSAELLEDTELRWLLRTEPALNVLETLQWSYPSSDLLTHLSLAVTFEDLDGDRELDAKLDWYMGEWSTPPGRGQGSSRNVLHWEWLHRPSGYERNFRTTVSELATGMTPIRAALDEKLKQIGSHEERGAGPGTLQEAERNVWVQRKLEIARWSRLARFFCSAEGELRVGRDKVGKRCDDQELQTSLEYARASVSAWLGDWKQALEPYALQGDDTRYRKTLVASAERPVREFSHGPFVPPPIAVTRRSGIRFLDRTRLYLASPPPPVQVLDDERTEPSVTDNLDIQSPSGKWTVLGFHGECVAPTLVLQENGLRNPVERMGSHAMGIPSRRLVAATDRKAPCPDLGQASNPVRSMAGLYVVGWAPQGVVVLGLREAWVVPVRDGKSLGKPSRFSASRALPGPLRSGVVAPGGYHYVLPLPEGLAVVRRGARPGLKLVRPGGWTEDQGSIVDVAISSHGNRVAYVQDQVVHVVDLAP